MKLDSFQKGFEGCDTVGDLGWKWGTESIGTMSPGYKELIKMLADAGLKLTDSEFEDFKSEFYEARRGW